MNTPDNTPHLNKIDIKSPCSENWDAMTGDEQRRFCDICNKHVHNLSAMTAQKAEKLLDDRQGELCVRYQRDEHGQMINRPRLYRLHQVKKRTIQIARVAAVAIMAVALSPFSWAMDSTSKKAPCPVNPKPTGQQQYKLGKPQAKYPEASDVEMGKPVHIQGGIPAPQPPKPQPKPAPSEFMGDVAEPPQPQQQQQPIPPENRLQKIEGAGEETGDTVGKLMPPPESTKAPMMGELPPPTKQ